MTTQNRINAIKAELAQLEIELKKEQEAEWPKKGDTVWCVSDYGEKFPITWGGTYEERAAMAQAKEAERERLWQEKQRQRREERLKAEAIRPRASPKLVRSRLMLAAMLAAAGANPVGEASGSAPV